MVEQYRILMDGGNRGRGVNGKAAAYLIVRHHSQRILMVGIKTKNIENTHAVHTYPINIYINNQYYDINL